MLSPAVIGSTFDASRAGETHDRTIVRFMQAFRACEGNEEKQAALVSRLERVVTLKVDLALMRAVSIWNAPSLSALALFIYGLDAVTGEGEKQSFRDAIIKLVPEAVREVMAKKPLERFILWHVSRCIFSCALKVNGVSPDDQAEVYSLVGSHRG
ncbi:MAG: hypothetical protein LBF26_00305 [Puniceicoccales bacterium]|jgi:hypothetical protein|nr:hypothetical protein [Puniceicoccales bacterium]